jgi:hypothetical protein
LPDANAPGLTQYVGLAGVGVESRIGIAHPGRFTTEVVFRRCEKCRERNVVKDGWFRCGVCGAELPGEWNF